jgi:YVTN family beta-propeller protein
MDRPQLYTELVDHANARRAPVPAHDRTTFFVIAGILAAVGTPPSLDGPPARRTFSAMRPSLLASLALLLPAAAFGQAKEYLYVGNTLGGDISVIAIPAHKVVGTIPASVVGNSPDDIISTRRGDVLYISRLDTKDVIAVSTSTEQQLWRAEVGGTPNHLALSSDERFLYVPIYDKGQLAVIDTKTHAVIKRLDVGKGAHGTILGPSGKYLYVGMMEANQIAVIDVARNEVKKIIPMPEGVRPFQLSPNEKTLYAQLSKLHGFVVVDLTKDRVVRTIQMPLAGKPAPSPSLNLSHWVVNHGMGITSDGKYLLANGSLSDFTAIYSLPDLELLATIPVGKTPNWVVFSKNGQYAYVSNRGDNTLSVISVRERKEVARLKVGEFPQRMTVAMANRKN